MADPTPSTEELRALSDAVARSFVANFLDGAAEGQITMLAAELVDSIRTAVTYAVEDRAALGSQVEPEPAPERVIDPLLGPQWTDAEKVAMLDKTVAGLRAEVLRACHASIEFARDGEPWEAAVVRMAAEVERLRGWLSQADEVLTVVRTEAEYPSRPAQVTLGNIASAAEHIVRRDEVDGQSSPAAPVPPLSEARADVILACPPASSGLTPCCGRTPFELPRLDRLTVDPALVTCRPAAPQSPQTVVLVRRLRDALDAEFITAYADERAAADAWLAEHDR